MMETSQPFSLIVIIATFGLSAVFTSLARRVLLAGAVLDIPNERSSHHIATPRGGGWALLAVLLPALIGATYWIDHGFGHAGLIVALVLLAAVSWVDDRRSVSAAHRLSLHLAAAWMASFSFPPTDLLFAGALPLWADRTIMIVGWTWFINLYNFMDGIDGITGTETISIAVGLCLVETAASLDDPFTSFLSLCLCGACLGFLIFNWHPARLFLGDVGSVPLGLLVGFCLLSLAVKGYLAAAIVLPLYYLADSGITLGARALRGEKIWTAHRQHFYQRASAPSGRHDHVVRLVALGNIGLIVGAVVSIERPLAGLSIGIVMVAILLKKMHKMSSLRIVER